MHNHARKIAWLAAMPILLLGWGVFITNIGFESVWYDEWISWSMGSSSTLGDLFARYPLGTGHPPVFFMTLWAWIKVTGSEDIFVMRFAAAFPMLIALAVTYMVGCKWFRNHWVGLGAAAFMATSGLIIYYARELRMYGLLILLTTVSWWLWGRVLGSGGRFEPQRAQKTQRILDREQNTRLNRRDAEAFEFVPKIWRYTIGYGVVLGVMALTHYISAFMALMQLMAALLLYTRRVPRLLASYVITAIPVALWLPTFLSQATEASKRAGFEGELSLGSVGQFDATRPTTLARVEEFFQLYSANQITLLIALVLIGLALGVSATNPRWLRQRTWAVFLWGVATVALVMAVNLVMPIYSSRYVLYVIPGLALLVGLAVGLLPAQARLSLLAAVMIGGLYYHTTAFKPMKTPHQDMLTTIDARRLPGDRIWYNLSLGALGSNLENEVKGYYLAHITPDLVPEMFIWDAPEDFRDPAVRRVWDVRPYYIPMPREARDNLALYNRQLSERYRYGGWDVRLYEAPPLDQTPSQFGDLFALQVGALDRTTVSAGEVVPLKLWWRALEPIPLDYSLGVYLRDGAGKVIAQWDGGLTTGLGDDARPSSQWHADGEFALGVPEFTIPADTPPGEYGLWVGVYYWETPTPLEITGGKWEIDTGSNILKIADVMVRNEE